MTTAELATLVEEFVAALPATAHRVLEYLAVDDPLPLAELVRAGRAAKPSPRRRSPARSSSTTTRCDRPIRCSSTPCATRWAARNCADCARSWSSGSAPRRLATWWTCYGWRCWHWTATEPQPTAELVKAAEEALRLGDLVLSERLGRAALQRTAGLPARLTLAYALAWQGRGRDADSVLAQVDPSTLSEAELMAWALPRGGQPVLDVVRAGARDGVPAGDAQQGVVP